MGERSVVPSIIWTVMGVITMIVSFAIKDYFIGAMAIFMFLLVILNELDIYLSRRAGVDPDRDYVNQNKKEGGQ